MNETAWITAALAAAFLVVVLYMAVKDRETGRKIAMMEAGIDGLGQEIFKLSKEIDKLRQEMREELMRRELESRQEGMSEEARKLAERLEEMHTGMLHLQRQIDGIHEELRERVETLDGKVRQVTFASEHAAPDEQKILQLHAQGMDSETIAKQLRLGKGEVELVLKFSKIHA